MASSWRSLPPEIRLLTLRYIVPEYGLKETTIDRGFPRASLLATVSEEWQDFFERETFRRMDLEATDLYTFSRTIIGKNVVRLNYITNVLLTIKLVTYTRRIAGKTESKATVTQNHRIFTQAMAALLKTLASWPGIHGGLTLEIRAHSPSDQEFHGNLLELYDDYPYRFAEHRQTSSTLFRFYKKNRKLYRRARITRRSLDLDGMARRLRGTPLELKPSLVKKRHYCSKTINDLPKTPIVRGLVLRPNSRRGIAVTSLATLFRECFVELRMFRFAKWEGLTEEQETSFLSDLQQELAPSFPASLKRFVFAICRDYDSHYSRDVNTSLSELMGNNSHRFTQFCPPCSISSLWFFIGTILGARHVESKLQYLAFRPRAYLSPWMDQAGVSGLLEAAALVVPTLPKLRILELWNVKDGYGCLFRCTLDESRVTITWRCTDERLALEESVIRQWAVEVASDRVFTVERIPLPRTAKHGGPFVKSTILPFLHLRGLNYDPITEAHIRFSEKV